MGEIIARALARDPARRYADAREFARAVAAAVLPLSVKEVMPPSAMPRKPLPEVKTQTTPGDKKTHVGNSPLWQPVSVTTLGFILILPPWIIKAEPNLAMILLSLVVVLGFLAYRRRLDWKVDLVLFFICFVSLSVDGIIHDGVLLFFGVGCGMGMLVALKWSQPGLPWRAAGTSALMWVLSGSLSTGLYLVLLGDFYYYFAILGLTGSVGMYGYLGWYNRCHPEQEI